MPFDGSTFVETKSARVDASQLEVLRGALTLIQRGWTQRRLASYHVHRRWYEVPFVRLEERPVSYHASEATHFCLAGALFRAAHDRDIDSTDAENRLARVIGVDLARWNDAKDRTKAQVVAVLREAIRRAELDARIQRAHA